MHLLLRQHYRFAIPYDRVQRRGFSFSSSGILSLSISSRFLFFGAVSRLTWIQRSRLSMVLMIIILTIMIARLPGLPPHISIILPFSLTLLISFPVLTMPAEIAMPPFRTTLFFTIKITITTPSRTPTPIIVIVASSTPSFPLVIVIIPTSTITIFIASSTPFSPLVIFVAIAPSIHVVVPTIRTSFSFASLLFTTTTSTTTIFSIFFSPPRSFFLLPILPPLNLHFHISLLAKTIFFHSLFVSLQRRAD
mmetsp:Transcript_25487/g.41942  ORF Transcript_25487/g.41942 Transcript_25487/m.41942 type:complete len:250 (+) Transcript_25487:421-1170(+)